MFKRERHAYIIHQLNVHNKILSSDLTEQLKVSEDTVRRDLQELYEQNKLLKVHGGALSQSFHFSLKTNNIYSIKAKQVIAKKAVDLIKDGMFVLLSGGTTIHELVKALPPQLNATFITVSVPIALELLNHPTSEVIFIGNRLLKSAQIAVGADVIRHLADIKADLCFLGVNAIDVKEGITDLDWEVIEVKRAIMKASNKTVTLAISEKLNTVQRLKVCSIKEIDILITEKDPADECYNTYKTEGISVI